MIQELQNISSFIDNFELDGNNETDKSKKTKRRRRVKHQSVQMMSQALKNFKLERKNVEEDLVKTITKVNLDKQILF